MEDTTNTIISNFSKTLGCFCKNLQTSSDALKDSMERRPIPLDSASSTFINCLNRRVSSASSDLNLLESMAFGTVSFEELLGHCHELYKKNQYDLVAIEDRLKSSGYIPGEIDDEDELSGLTTPIAVDGLDSDLYLSRGTLCDTGSIMKRLEEDPSFEESLSLQNLGLSDVCLATLASEANGGIVSPDVMSIQKPLNVGKLHGTKVQYQPAAKSMGMIEGHVGSIPEPVVGASQNVINLSKVDYENLPSFMKNLASWEDLNVAVIKMNSTLSKQEEKPTERNLFYQDKLASLELGPKVRSYLLLLLRMNRLVVETVNGSIAYRVL